MKSNDLSKSFGSILAFVGCISALPYQQAYRVQPQPVSLQGNRNSIDERAGGGSGGFGVGAYGGVKSVQGASGGGYAPLSSPGSPGGQGGDGAHHTETKYYYGGKYEGDCASDGLYYRDDTAFVICSNGYPHEQPCPPGTKTSGSPKYQAGYYYGYTDLCSVNLVDYGYAPEYYAPKGYPVPYGEGKDGGYGGAERRNDAEAYPGKREPGSTGLGGGFVEQQSKYPDRVPDLRSKDVFGGNKNADFDRSGLLSGPSKDRFGAARGTQRDDRISYPEVKGILPDKAIPNKNNNNNHAGAGGGGGYPGNFKVSTHNAAGAGAYPGNFKDIDVLSSGRSSYVSGFDKNKPLERNGFESASSIL